MTHAQPRDNEQPASRSGYTPRRLAGPIVAGVVPGQGLAVVHRAVDLAHGLGVSLVFAYSDPTSLEEAEPGGRVAVVPIDPDAADDDAVQIRSDLAEGLRAELAGSGVEWRLVVTAGEPAHALASLAEELNASAIVVGTRESGLAHRLEERLAGSVATHLSHQQERPVVVVPVPHGARGPRRDGHGTR
ncbi:universal stress protein [Sinomonas sp. JGH33]|uniref:Universal stress protein n=1 Tax=Sinomonas terricola TaxID=3110330 RepID=A0ABU5T6V9_9MICC|nr:universal stress protein [Sinomonas sp. JGH33]MEA5455409.1 universal stress protein [Sinomonas sp. JGH33]